MSIRATLSGVINQIIIMILPSVTQIGNIAVAINNSVAVPHTISGGVQATKEYVCCTVAMRNNLCILPEQRLKSIIYPILDFSTYIITNLSK